MPERPLLVFPVPTDVSRYKLSGGPSKAFIKPTRVEQINRIGPQYTVLENAFNARRIELQSDVTGIEPEMVLVFETRGTLTDFLKALKNFPDLEWMGDLEREFAPDDLFYYQDDETKQVRGKVFFVMSNRQGLLQLKSLWDNYYIPGLRFQRGNTKWRDLFDLLHDIRFWGFQDRISETGIMNDWNFRVQSNQERMPFEVELWYRTSENQRQTTRNRIEELIEEFEGQVLKECSIEDINYHSLLIEAPIGIFNNLNENTNISFFKTADIMFLRPVGQCAIKLSNEIGAEVQIEREEPEATLPPVVALLDGMPIQNHALLQNRLIVDDPDNYAENYPAQNRKHGTAMASLIVNGDLNANETPLKSKLYLRPVMRYSDPFEQIPENELVVDLIHRSIRRMFEVEAGAVANSIKVINLSIGDPVRIYDNYLSPLAKLLDWLSFKYNILFIVSAGNCFDEIEFDGQLAAILENPESLERGSINFFYENLRHRKIISPGEAINALTAGAAHSDLTNLVPNAQRINIYEHPQLPSPISRLGFGHRRSIKPDLLVPGGRVLFRQPLATSGLQIHNSILEPGQKVAYPGQNGGPIGIAHTKGTSNSAAVLSRAAGQLFESLNETQNIPEPLVGEYFVVVAKSLLVHGASWSDDITTRIINSIPGFAGNEKDLVSRFIGYGSFSKDRIIECTEKRVTLIGYGTLEADEAHRFALPLPNSISGPVMWKRLTVTLAWMSPVNPKNQVYRNSKLWFDFPDKNHEHILNLSRRFYDNDTVNRGTVQHEIFEANNASAFVDGANLSIRVNCKEDSPKLTSSVRYGLSATLEVSANADVNIYNEVRQKLLQQVQV